MTLSADQQRSAWGMELTTRSARLVRVAVAESSARTVLTEQRFEKDNPGAPFSEALLTALTQIPATEPLAICFPDHAMMCRGLSLPRSPVDLTEKMVDAQASAFFFDAGDRLNIAWQSADHPFETGMQWVVICAAQRTWLDEIKRALPSNVALVSLTPRILTVPSLATESSTQLLVEASDEGSTFALCANGLVLRAVVLDMDDQADAGEWNRTVRQSFFSLVDGLSRSHWPSTGVVRHANAEQADALSRELTDILQLKLSVEQPSDAAVVAAERLLNSGGGKSLVNFAEVAKADVPPPTALPRRKLIEVLAVCLLGILVWYGITCFRDWSLTQKFRQLRDAEASAGGVERRLAVGHYLERNASPALLVFDVILTTAPPSLNMTTFGVNASGQCHLVAMVGSASELDDFMHKLQTSPVLTNVQLKSAHVEQQRWQVDMTADTKPMSGLMAALPAVAVVPGKPPGDPRMAGGR